MVSSQNGSPNFKISLNLKSSSGFASFFTTYLLIFLSFILSRITMPNPFKVAKMQMPNPNKRAKGRS
jgi:hypothetical protein